MEQTQKCLRPLLKQILPFQFAEFDLKCDVLTQQRSKLSVIMYFFLVPRLCLVNKFIYEMQVYLSTFVIRLVQEEHSN